MRLPTLLLAGATAITAGFLGYKQFVEPRHQPADGLLSTAPTLRAPEVVQAPAPAPAQTSPDAGKPAAARPARPDVDESALRYFARQGDKRRLEIEIARLRALYPGWEPPANPLEGTSAGDPQLDRMWSLYAEGKLAEVRKAIADRQAAEPAWVVPEDLLQRLALAKSASSWSTRRTSSSTKPSSVSARPIRAC